MKLVLSLPALASLSATAHAQVGGPAVTLPFEDVPGYDDYAIARETAIAIRDEAMWRRVHEAFYSVTTCDPECRLLPPPPVDFERQMVLLVGGGRTRCMLREPPRLIHNVERRGGVVFVWAGPLPEVFGAPAEAERAASDEELPICSTALDYLVHMVTVERSDLPVLFGGLYGYVPPPQGPFEE